MRVPHDRRAVSHALLLAVACALLPSCATNTSPSDTAFVPGSHGPGGPLTAAVRRGTTVPYWSSSFTFGGTTYGYRMVGTDPAAGAATTTVAATIVPLAMTFSNGKTFDGTAGGQSALLSPLFVPSRFPEGKTQFGDAVMRGEFWQYARGESYHVLLAPTLVATQSIAVPAADGSVETIGGKRVGVVAFAWFVDTIEPQIIAQLGLSPTGLTIFVPSNVRLLEQNGGCCYHGFHAAITQKLPTGIQTLTTVFAPDGDVSVVTLSHEIAEWLNDPFNDNVVPKWISPVTGKCDSDKLEVADPLVTHLFRLGGYQLQDVAFLSWFSQDAPSNGIGGAYDLRGVLTTPATICSMP